MILVPGIRSRRHWDYKHAPGTRDYIREQSSEEASRRTPSSSQSVKNVRQGFFIRLYELSPIFARRTPHYLCRNPYFDIVLFCFLLRTARQHQSTSTARQRRYGGRHRQSASSRQKHQTTVDAFQRLGKRSPPVSSELLRSFFDVIPEPNKATSALKSKCKTCKCSITMTQDLVFAHFFAITGSGATKCPKPPAEAGEIAAKHQGSWNSENANFYKTRPTHKHIMYVYCCCRY